MPLEFQKMLCFISNKTHRLCSISCFKAMETYCPRLELPVSRYPFFSERDCSMSVLAIGIRAFKNKHRICLQTLQNSFPSQTMKSSPGNCRIRSCNGTFEFTVSLLPRRLYLPEVDCTDRSLAIDEADTILAEEEKDFPAYHSYLFFPLVLVRHVTETDNLHTSTQHKYTSNITHKQSKQTGNNRNYKTLGLFILLRAEIWISVMKHDRKC